MNHESAPEKYSGKNKEGIKKNKTPQKACVTFKQSTFADPVISIAVYQHMKEYIPIPAITARSIQQGAYEKTAAKPSKADPNPPAIIKAMFFFQ